MLAGWFPDLAEVYLFQNKLCIRMVYVDEDNRTEKLNETPWKKDKNCISGLFI
jgi:hypothetical protein